MVSQSGIKKIDEESTRLQSTSVSFLQELVRTPSVNPSGDYKDIHNLLIDSFEDFGWEVETLWAPDELLDELGLDHQRPNILAWVTRGDGPTIALRSHFDTVPVDESQWSVDPFGGEVKGGKLYGRGATDEKGQIAAHTLAIRILESIEAVPDNATIVIICDADEETDGKAGAGYVTDKDVIRPDYVLGQGFVNEVWHAGLGLTQYKIEIKGKSSHAGVNPNNNLNPILPTRQVLETIEEYASRLKEMESSISPMGNPTCTLTSVETDSNISMVPDTTTITIDQRFPPDFNREDLIQKLTDSIDSIKKPSEIDIDISVIEEAGSYFHDPNEKHVEIIRSNANEFFDHDIPAIGTRNSGGNDPEPRWPYRPPKTHYYASLDADCVHFGPGSITNNIHDADEYIKLEEVRKVGATIATSILDLTKKE